MFGNINTTYTHTHTYTNIPEILLTKTFKKKQTNKNKIIIINRLMNVMKPETISSTWMIHKRKIITTNPNNNNGIESQNR